MIVALTGAGISTESGIPDFRSPGGVWERFDPEEFHIQRFHADPAQFWKRRAALIAAMDYLDAAPNEAHHLLAKAARQGRARIITQNVDGLHAKAGTPPEALLELHGNGAVCRCMACGQATSTDEALARMAGATPLCACGGLLRPGVVLFGEPVPAMEAAIPWVAEAEALWVVGTSLRVHPAASLVDVALTHEVPVTIFNRDSTPYDRHATVLRGSLAVHLRQAFESATAAAPDS